MTLEELKKIITEAGIVGAGGAGFPTAVKLAENADTLMINAAECEPLLYSDYTLMKRHLDDVAAGAEYVLEATGIRRSLLGVKQHTAERLGLQDGQQLSAHVSVKCLPNVYPMGDEVILIYQALGRIVPPGQLPLTVGVIVMNAETLYNVCHAVREGTPVIHKWITVNGKVAHPLVTVVPVGTPVRELMNRYGFSVPEDCVMIDGGPAMGPIIDPEKAVITKTTKGLLILPKTAPAIRSKLANNRTVMTHASANCCQCSICSDMCPRALIGYPLRPHRIVRNSLSMIEENPESFLEASVCCGCGVCELTACCQGISPRRVYQQVKGILAKNKLRYQYKGEPLTPDPDREYRMLPSERFMQRIGVAEFDTGIPDFVTEEYTPTVIRLPLRQHVGAPATAQVAVGDTVSVGQCVAAASGMISANIHSSVDGIVESVSASDMVIRVKG